MKNKLLVALLILSGILIYHFWFLNYSVMSFGDWGYFLPNTQRELFSLPTIWNSSEFGTIDISLSMYPINFLWGVLSFVSGFALSERLLYLFPSVILSLLGSYYLVKKNIHSSIAAFIGALVFTYNSYVIVGRTGHLTLMTAFALSTFLLLFFQKTLEYKKIYYSLLTGLVAFLVSIYEFRAFYIMVLILFFYFLYFQFIIEKTITKSSLFKNIILAFIPFCIVGVLNSYWIIGFLNLGTLTTNEIFSRTLFGNEFANLTYAFTLFHPFWTGGKPTEFITQPVPFYFWFIPFFAFLGLLLNRRNKQVLFFSIITLLGIFLTKQVDQPFSAIYPWLYNHFPGFNAFRESSKFYFLIGLGYSVLIAAFVDWIWHNWTKAKWKVFGKYFLTLSIIGILLWNTKPLITGEIATLLTPRHVPQDYLLINDFISKQNDFSRTYWVPTYSRWSTYLNNHPRISAVLEINGLWSNFINKEKRMEKFTESELMLKLLQKPYANNLLDVSSIKYVFVPLEDIENDDNFFRYYGKSRQYYIRELDKLTYLKKVNIGTKSIIVYENKYYYPLITSSDKKLNLNQLNNLQKVDYKFINASEYRIQLRNIKKPIVLNFADSYHPQWLIRVGNFNWFEALFQKNYFVSSNQHSKNEFIFNSYFIDPQKLCREFSCVKTKDGGYDIEVTLYFKPQSYVYLGGIISFVILVCLVSYLSIKIIYAKRKEN